MVGRSESLPIIIPTTGLASLIFALRVLSFQYLFCSLFHRILSSARRSTLAPKPLPAWLRAPSRLGRGLPLYKSCHLRGAFQRDIPSHPRSVSLHQDRRSLSRFLDRKSVV